MLSKSHFYRTILVGTLGFCFTVSAPAFAQNIGDLSQSFDIKSAFDQVKTNSVKDYLTTDIVPANPDPGQQVTITLESYLTDLDKASISWSINGKISEQGTGIRSFTFTNGASGTTTTVDVSITTNTGGAFTKTFVFNPSNVTVLWEAHTYTPPFYKGKPLPSPEAEIRAVAIPDNVGLSGSVDPSNLAFVWKEDSTVNTTASGYGKNTFIFKAPRPYQKTSIGVRLSSLDDKIFSEKKITTPTTSPFVLFYEDHPLLGPWYNRPFGDDLTLTNNELSLIPVPFFFSNEGLGGNAPGPSDTLRYSWALDGADQPNTGRVITLSNQGSAEGTSKLSLTIQGLGKTFQAATRDLVVRFTGGNEAKPF